MTKKEFEKVLVEKGVFKTQKESAEKVSIILETITESLVNGDGINFLGWGKIEAIPTPKRIARNPKTGEPVTIE
ncbi:MAG: HU family DNA-binding protein, partial [Cetobacterium sp.]